ncbi:Zinc-metallopeptidase [Nymphaea thermarum]|nr:Zinc-metallopeptidase [Nymphaea thermarum]
MGIFWESKSFKGHTDMVEPWYQTEFSVDKITDAIVQKWIDASPNDELHLPAPNLFIPTDLAIKEVQQANYPFLLRKTSFSRLWYKPDNLFLTPKAFIKIDFSCPESRHSPDAEVLTDIFTPYDAQVAGLRYKISQSDFGFQLTVFGYNHKMKLLLDAIIEKVAQFEVKLERFSVIKESMVKEYENFKFRQPYQQAMYYSALILEDNSWPWNEKLEALVHLEAEELSKFSHLLLSRTFFECYAAGNIGPSEAETLVIDIEKILFHSPKHMCKPLFSSQFLTNRIVKLQTARSHFYPVQCLNQDNENSALLFYVQVIYMPFYS